MQDRPGPSRPSLLLLMVVAAAVAGCGEDMGAVGAEAGDDTGEIADSGETSEPTEDIAEAPRVPRLRFLIDETPHGPSDAEVAATAARWGDPIRIVVDGLEPGAITTVAVTSAAGSSQAVFAADTGGVVDLGRDAPIALDGMPNDWSEAHVDGFLWSMRGAPPGAFDPAITAWAFVGDEEVASGVLARRALDADIVGESLADGALRGLFARPAGDDAGPFGGVMCFGGSEGGTYSGERCAMYLASLGYAALGVGYFGATGLPDDLAEVPLEILEADLAWLSARPEVAPGGVVVVGGSRGGELALLLGARFAAVAGVVARVPSGYVWASLGGDRSAWSWDGVPLPYIPSADAFAQPALSSEGARGYAMRNTFDASVAQASEEARAAATIAIEEVAGPVVLQGGADDQLWPSCALADVAYQRLVVNGHTDRYADVFACHEDAGHFSVGTPGWSMVGSTSAEYPELGINLVLGGTVAGNAKAMRANDSALRALLERVLGPGRITAPSSRSGL